MKLQITFIIMFFRHNEKWRLSMAEAEVKLFTIELKKKPLPLSGVRNKSNSLFQMQVMCVIRISYNRNILLFF